MSSTAWASDTPGEPEGQIDTSAPRYCVFGEVHGNLEALEAVVADAKRQGVGRFVCLGDTVGYGASPSECVDRVQSLTTQVVAGNHDCAVVERIDPEHFLSLYPGFRNVFALDAMVWTRTQLSPTDKAFLRDLPLRGRCRVFKYQLSARRQQLRGSWRHQGQLPPAGPARGEPQTKVGSRQ